MKIEIDSSRPDELRKMKAEHEFALRMIDAALSAIGNNTIDPKQPALPAIQESVTVDSSKALSKFSDFGDLKIGYLLDRFDTSKFTSSDVFALAESEQIPRSLVRRELAELVHGGWLLLVETGQGRRPSSYRKK